MFIKTNLGCSVYEIIYGNLGGMCDKPDRRGASHILEHMKCREMHFHKDYDISLLRNGIKYNATTDNECVKFSFKGMNLSHNYLKEVAGIIYDALKNSQPLSEEEFKGELNTVQNEFVRHMSNTSNVVHYYKNKQIFEGYGTAIGEGEDIAAYSYREYLQDREIFNVPTQILLIDKEDWNELDYDVSLTNGKRYKYVMNKQEISEGGRNIFFIASPSSDDKSALLLELGMNCLAYDLRCPLQDLLRNKYNLIYCVETETFHIKDLASHFRIFTMNPKAAVEVAYEILSNPYKYISEEHFALYKRVTMIQKEARRFYKEMDSNHFIRKEAGFIDSEYEFIEKATYEEVMENIKKQFVTDGQCYQYNYTSKSE